MPDNAMSPARASMLTALAYAGLVLIIAGGSGIWVPAVMPGKEVGIDALTTYVMATLAPLMVDMVLQPDDYIEKLSPLFKVGVLLLAGIAGLLAFVALLRESHDHTWRPWGAGWFAVVLTLATWLVLARKSKRFAAPKAESNTGPLGTKQPSPVDLKGGGLSP